MGFTGPTTMGMGGRSEGLGRAAGLALGAVVVATPAGFFAFLDTPSDSQRAAFVLASALCGLLAAGAIGLCGRPPRLAPVWYGAIAAQIASLALSVAISQQPAYALSRAVFPAAGIVFFVAAATVLRTENDLEKVCVLWTIAGFALGALAILQAFGSAVGIGRLLNLAGLELAEGVTGKMSAPSLFGHPNHFASALVPIFFIALAVNAGAGKLWRFLKWMALAVLGMALVLTGTRGAWLAVAVGMGVYGILLARAGILGRRRLATAALAALVFCLFGWLICLPNPFIVPRFDLRERLVSGAEARSRLYSWLIAADMARDKPLLGHGVGSYDARFWEYVARRQAGPAGQWFETTVILMNGTPPRHPHNEYLSLACEQGVVGVGAFALLVACGAVAVWRLTGKLADASYSGRGVRGEGVGVGEMNANDPPEGGTPNGAMAAALGAGVMACMIDACFMFPFHLAVSYGAFLFLLAGLARLSGHSARGAP